MTGLLDLICSAIARQEGWWASGSRPAKLHNPGDLRAAPWLPVPTIINGYWEAESDAQGIAGLYHQVALDVARGCTLRQLILKWAPSSDGNDPTAYLEHVMAWTGIVNADAPLASLLELKFPGS